MTSSSRFLQILMRIVGTAGLLAIPFALMHHSGMDAIHQALGMGKLPGEPIVGYLARSASLFYAVVGGLLWVLSYDLRRYRNVLIYLGATLLAFGVLLFAFDILEGMPWWWICAEGPFNVVFAAVVLILARRIPSSSDTLSNESEK